MTLPFQIRQIDAAQTWPLRHTVMWPNKPLDYIKLADDDTGIHFGVFVVQQQEPTQEELLVSVVSLFLEIDKDDDNGTCHAQFRKLATDTAYQRRGFASRLLEHAFEFCRKAPTSGRTVKRIWCNARSNKTKFYKKFGMVETTQTFTKGGIGYVIMEHVIPQQEGSGLKPSVS